MELPGIGKGPLPYDMFEIAREAEVARRAEKLANLYHRGQELIWSGRKVLPELLQKHGGVTLAEPQRSALGAVLNILLWGELAAWKIAAQLADGLVPLEVKLAATAQAHDEARHFYVLVDYLRELGVSPTPLTRRTRLLLDSALLASHPVRKVTGMQLLIEAMALTLFQALRESKIEPVLCELLLYYEKDEARHVGLGLQYLPPELKRLRRRDGLRLLAFEIQLLLAAIAELKGVEPHLRVLGIDARRVFLLGTAKVALTMEMLWNEQTGGEEHPWISRALSAIGELAFPEAKPGEAAWQRALAVAREALRVLRAGAEDKVPAVSLDPEGKAVPITSVWRRRG